MIPIDDVYLHGRAHHFVIVFAAVLRPTSCDLGLAHAHGLVILPCATTASGLCQPRGIFRRHGRRKEKKKILGVTPHRRYFQWYPIRCSLMQPPLFAVICFFVSHWGWFLGGVGARGAGAMRHVLSLVVCGVLSHESDAFVPGGTRASFFGVQPHQQPYAGGFRRLGSRPRTMMQAEVAADTEVEATEVHRRKKVVVVGAGWAGLAAAYELSKQVCDAGLNFQNMRPSLRTYIHTMPSTALRASVTARPTRNSRRHDMHWSLSEKRGDVCWEKSRLCLSASVLVPFFKSLGVFQMSHSTAGVTHLISL